MVDQSDRQTFTAALDSLVAQIQQDRSILAALLCGSLSHDTVWAKSDIDLILVTSGRRETGSRLDRALRRWRQRPRVSDSAHRVPAHGRRIGPELVHALAARQGPSCCTRTTRQSRACATACADSAPATKRSSSSAPRPERSRPSTRRTSGSSRAETSTTPRSGSCTRQRRWRRLKSSAPGWSRTVKSFLRR